MAMTRDPQNTHSDFSDVLNATGQIVQCLEGKENVLGHCFKVSDHYFMTASLHAMYQHYQPLNRNLFLAEDHLFIKFNIEHVNYYCKTKIAYWGTFYIPNIFTYTILELIQPLPSALSLQSAKINMHSFSDHDEVVTVNYSQGKKSLSFGTVLSTASPQLYFFKENRLESDPWMPQSKPHACYATFIQHSARIEDEATGSPLISMKSHEIIGISIQFPEFAKNGYFALPIKNIIDAAIQDHASEPWLSEMGLIKITQDAASIKQFYKNDKEVKVSQSSIFSPHCVKGIAIGLTGLSVGLCLYRWLKK